MRYVLIFIYITATPPITVLPGQYDTHEACQRAAAAVNRNIPIAMCVEAPKP